MASDLRRAISDQKSLPRKGRELTAPLDFQLPQETLLQTTSRFKGCPSFTSGFMNNRTHSARFVLPWNPAGPEEKLPAGFRAGGVG